MKTKQSSDVALKEYRRLKKNNFSDREIRKIAHILFACAADELQWPS